MSIYATWLSLGDHSEDCAVWVEIEAGSGIFDRDESRCDCQMKEAPVVYQGSHILPGPADRRGGWLDVGIIPDHITRDNHPEGAEGQRKSYLRLSMGSEDSDTIYEGRPYVQAGQATLVLDTEQVKRLRDTLDDWLSDGERA